MNVTEWADVPVLLFCYIVAKLLLLRCKKQKGVCVLYIRVSATVCDRMRRSKIIATQSITKYRILTLGIGLGPQHRAAGNLMAPDDNLTLTDASKGRAGRPPLGIINCQGRCTN